MPFFSPSHLKASSDNRDLLREKRLDWTFGERKDKYKISLCQRKRGENQVQSTSASGTLKGKFA